MNKKVILIASFGSSYETARDQGIRPVEEAIESAFIGFDFARSYTSNRIRAKLLQEGVTIDAPQEALEKLMDQGYQDIFVQPLHILPGFEYEKIQSAIEKLKKPGYRLHLGGPLLATEADILEVVDVLASRIQEVAPGKQVILVGHGTEHPANEMYHRLEEKLIEAQLPILFGTIEAGVDEIIPKLKKIESHDFVLMPFLLVAGDHVLNDMMSNDKASWCSRLTDAGYNVTLFAKGIGENKLFQQLYVKRINSLVEKEAVG